MVNWLAETSVDPLPESSVVADTNLNIILSHLALKPFLESQDGSVDSILQLQILGVSEHNNHLGFLGLGLNTDLFSRKVLPLTWFFPIAVAFHAK